MQRCLGWSLLLRPSIPDFGAEPVGIADIPDLCLCSDSRQCIESNVCFRPTSVTTLYQSLN